jgi:hypothetical protein
MSLVRKLEDVRSYNIPIINEGVYFFLVKDVILYIGQSVNVIARALNHTTSPWFRALTGEEKKNIEFLVYNTNGMTTEERKDLEEAFIYCYEPIYNKTWQHNGNNMWSHRYIGITEEELELKLLQGIIPNGQTKYNACNQLFNISCPKMWNRRKKLFEFHNKFRSNQ